MGEHQQQMTTRYRRMGVDELAAAPLEALGLVSSDVVALKLLNIGDDRASATGSRETVTAKASSRSGTPAEGGLRAAG
jgi:hypothetical protein